MPAKKKPLSHGWGYRPDPPHKKNQRKFRAHLAKLAAGPVPTEASLRQFEAPIMDQGETGSCTGHGTAQAIFITLAAHRIPIEWIPSQLGIYRLARAQGRAEAMSSPEETLPPLTDDGAMPSDVAIVVAKPGVRPMAHPPTSDGRFSDVEVATVNDEEPLTDVELDKSVSADNRIDTTDPQFIDLVRIAIAAGCAVDIGVFVDTTFMNYDGSAPIDGAPNLDDPSGGGHWLCISWYRYDTTSKKFVFGGPNSWGESWGESGHFEVTEDWLKAACSDCLAYTPTSGGAS